MNRFKVENLLDIEQEAEVVAFAIVNMIFRGDGKNKITEGNYFQINVVGNGKGSAQLVRRELKPEDEPQVTCVLMNPPFALKISEEKELDSSITRSSRCRTAVSCFPYCHIRRW